MLQVFSKEQRQKRNYLIHLLYVRKEYSECLDVIEDTLAQVNQLAEYPLYVKALILRHNGTHRMCRSCGVILLHALGYCFQERSSFMVGKSNTNGTEL